MCHSSLSNTCTAVSLCTKLHLSPITMGAATHEAIHGENQLLSPLFPFSFLTSTSCNWNLKVSILIWSWFCDGRMQVDVTLETEVEQEVHHLVSGILSLLFLFWLGISVPPVHLNQKIIQEFVTRASVNRQE